MEKLTQDLHFAWRQLRRSPGFALITVLTLALGIGATTAIFSMIEGVLLRPLPFRSGDRLVHVGYRDPKLGQGNVEFSVREIDDYRRRSRTFADLAEYHSMPFTLLGWGEPDRLQTAVVSANFFDVMGVTPLLGRTFVPEDAQPGGAPSIILSASYWRSRFGGDPGIVGRNVRMNDHLIRVVGVLPPLPAFPGDDKVFLTSNGCPARSSQRVMESRRARMLQLFGRLKPGATLAQAQAEVATVAGGLAREHPEIYQSSGWEVPVIAVQEELVHGFRPTVLLLAIMDALVLFIACTNVAGLMLARLLHRQQEVVLRSALGAPRSRLARQLLTESALLALLGGLFGLLLAAAAMKLLAGYAGRFTPRAAEIGLDGRVLLFALAVSLIAGLSCGAVPALQLARHNLADRLRTGEKVTAGKHVLRSILVVAQVAASFVLLIGAGLTIRSLFKLQDVDAGYQGANVLAARISLPGSRYASDEKVIDFFGPLLERLGGLPGVRAVGLASAVPLDGLAATPGFKIEGRPEPPEGQGPKTKYQIVSEGYFHALGIPLLAGRVFNAGDHKGTLPAAVVNQTFARRYWPSESPLGRRVQPTFADEWITIVGVVGDVKQRGLTGDTQPEMFLDFRQQAGGAMVFVKTAGAPAAVVPALKSMVHERDPDLAVADIRTLDQVRSTAIAPSRLTAMLLTLFAALAFVVTATGISGIVAFSVTERTQEIGVRSALGASRGSLLRLVLYKGVALVLLGLAAGLGGALMIARLLHSMLYGVAPVDPVTFAAVSLVLLLLTGLACVLPARRAMQIDPVTALRAE